MTIVQKKCKLSFGFECKLCRSVLNAHLKQDTNVRRNTLRATGIGHGKADHEIQRTGPSQTWAETCARLGTRREESRFRSHPLAFRPRCTGPEPPLIPLQAQPGSCHMYRSQEQKHLAQADGHIAELKAQIDHQRKNLKRIAERGEPSATAESFLHALEQSLRIFENTARWSSSSCANSPSGTGPP
jgi:hypothetical protein